MERTPLMAVLPTGRGIDAELRGTAIEATCMQRTVDGLAIQSEYIKLHVDSEARSGQFDLTQLAVSHSAQCSSKYRLSS